VLRAARTTPARISRAGACLRTSIVFRQLGARTNIRADLTASKRCIFASPVQLVSRWTRAWRCRRRKRLMESVSSFGTSCSEVTCEVQPESRCCNLRFSMKSGLSGSKIGPTRLLGWTSHGRNRLIARHNQLCSHTVRLNAIGIIRAFRQVTNVERKPCTVTWP
jgi:hypothetical protein